ncbi:MAG: AbgT family transporter [Myxococcales bacterium]|nr:AbgT family transporter [Myxococcales bacterium]
MAAASGQGRLPGLLDTIERVGNALPDPATLFLLGALLVLGLSQVAATLEWTVEKTVSREVREVVRDAAGDPLRDPVSGDPVTRAVLDPQTGRARREPVRVPVRAVGLLSSEGLYWVLRSMVTNFTGFPPLGVVLVGMLGIGVAERSGFVGAALKAVLLAVPASLLTPTIFFVGVMSSLGLDAGYVVLPPLAAALYMAVGRSPLVGIAAVFAGVSAGFSANLFITSLDPLLAEFSTAGARLIDPAYAVAATANWWFMIASTLLLTTVGWAVTAWWVEPRFHRKPPAEGGAHPLSPEALASQRLSPAEKRGLLGAAGAALLALAVFAAAVGIPGAPLDGLDGPFPRWVRVIVPLIFLGFLVPGLVYGVLTGSVRRDKDVARMMGEVMASMGPYVVLAFFAAQFIAYFAHSGLGEMLAIAGGHALARAALPAAFLMVGFIGVVMVSNLFIGSMSAKYAFFAPVFVPMFMQVGISPELTQVAYRVGDSVSNVITPLNPYVVILLVYMQRYMPRAGIGTLVALMLPYTVAFALAWTALLVVWMLAGVALGPAGPLAYVP